MKKLILLIFVMLGVNVSLIMAQSETPPGGISPGGNFDLVFDRFGNKYKLEDLLIKKHQEKPGNRDALAENVVPPSYLLCSAGYFDLYFEEGSGFETLAPDDIARRNVVCQVFTHLSNFITPADPSVKVNIWIRNFGNFTTYPNYSNILGLATSFYVVPNVNPGVGGLIDGQIWKTINSGVDAYTNVTSPLIAQAGSPGTGAFYHGMMAFNISMPWHTDLTTVTATNKDDLYTIVLHEATHTLGFASLINIAGQSNLGTNYPFFSRYDQYLQDYSSAPLVVGTSITSGMYDYVFNPSLTPGISLAPNPIMNPCQYDYTDCLLASKFAGTVNQAVFTPNCWQAGSSLSHLEDICASPTPYFNNQYYCMANASSSGSAYMIRHLKPEERGVLCDLGYNVDTVYGDTTYPGNYNNYGGSPCPGLQVAGVNDGITGSGYYTWITTPSGTVNFNGSDLLVNDYNADEFEGLEVINGAGSVSVASGTSATPVTFTAGTTPGIALLRYVPVNTTTGNRGNITYMYIYINGSSCTPTACNMILNEGFESGSNCGETNPPDNAAIDCWEPLIETPDYFVRGCTPSINADVTIPTGSSISIPATDTWNSGSGANDAFLGLGFYGGSIEEVEQTLLAQPMYPNIGYTISFWAKSVNAGLGGFGGKNRIVFRGDAGILAPLPSGSYSSTGTYLTEAIVPDNGEWHYYTLEFSHTAANPLDNLMVGNMGNTSGNDSYILIDDITLNPTAHTVRFNVPKALCAGQTTIDDLSKFVFPAAIPGSSFSGTGVSLSGSTYSFTAGGNGYYIIYYNYTNANGCSVSIPSKLLVTPAPRPTVSISTNPLVPPAYCRGIPIFLTASGADTYAWYGVRDSVGPLDSMPAILPCNGPCATVVVVPPIPGYKFSVIGTDSIGCGDTEVVYIPVVFCPCTGCGGGGGNPPVIKTFEMPQDVKHYTTKIVPGTNNYSVMAGTIFNSATASGANTIHFLMLNNNGDIIISKEYASTYMDERVVDIQGYTDGYNVTRWYIICHANAGGQDIIKVLCVDNWGNIRDQREYIDNMGHNLYPMSGTIWTDGMNDRRLFITGYQTAGPLVDYTTRKEAFVFSIDINWGAGIHMSSFPSYAYDWGSMLSADYDMPTRMTVVDGSNLIWITGSRNGFTPTSTPGNNPPQPPDRSAVMNLVIDPLTGAVISDNGFLLNMGSDDYSGPSDYGVDFIQINGENYILGNSASVIVSPAAMPFWYDMVPRNDKIWWIQPLGSGFSPSGSRQMYNNSWKNWASQAVPLGGGMYAIATLLEGPYSACIPPDMPDPNNVQVNMIMVDMNSGPAVMGPAKIYMTNTGTGLTGSINSFYDMGNPLSLMDYPPKFADYGATNLAINGPKFMNSLLNLKVMTPDASLNIPCGQFDCNGSFLDNPNYTIGSGYPVPTDIVESPNPSVSLGKPFTIPAPQTCHDQAGNWSYSHNIPTAPIPSVLAEKTTIYPNPTTGMITLQLAKNIEADAAIKVELQNILGQTIKVVYDGNVNGKVDINLPQVAEGVYIVQVYANNEIVLKEKLIIKK